MNNTKVNSLTEIKASELNGYECFGSYKTLVLDASNTKEDYNINMQMMNRLHCKSLADLGNGVWVKFLVDKYATKFYNVYSSSLCNRWSTELDDIEQDVACKFLQYCKNLEKKAENAKTDKELEVALSKLLQGVDKLHWTIKSIANTHCQRSAEKAQSQSTTVLDDSLLFNKEGALVDVVNHSLLQQDLVSHIKLNGTKKDGSNPCLSLLFARLQGYTKRDFETSTSLNYNRTKKTLESHYLEWIGDNK